MMKSIILSKSKEEAKSIKSAYGDYIKKNGHAFKEKKKESKLKHGIEKLVPRNLQNDADSHLLSIEPSSESLSCKIR